MVVLVAALGWELPDLTVGILPLSGEGESSFKNHLFGLATRDVTDFESESERCQCWGSYFLKIICYSYKLHVDKSSLLQLLVTFSTLVTCYSYCYFLKVTSYF